MIILYLHVICLADFIPNSLFGTQVVEWSFKKLDPSFDVPMMMFMYHIMHRYQTLNSG